MSHSSVLFLSPLLFLRVPFPYGPQVPVWKNAISSPAGACVGGASRQLSFFVREIAKSPILLTYVTDVVTCSLVMHRERAPRLARWGPFGRHGPPCTPVSPPMALNGAE